MTFLHVENLRTGYGRVEVLHSISLQVAAGEVVGVLGPNGAGKSTLLRAISRVIAASSGQIRLEGRDLSAFEPHRVPHEGLVMVPEARHIFPALSVQDNLMVGGTPLPSRKDRLEALQEIYELFPILLEKASLMAGSLSGGQQQMLAVGRALMSRPRMIMLDEPSLGLAPRIVEELYEKLRRLLKMGLTILLVEQDVHRALTFVDRAYVLESGTIALEGAASELAANDHIRRVYLGV